MKAKGVLPLGSTGGNINVAVKRPTVNVKEAENLGEATLAASRRPNNGVRFSKHGTFATPVNHAIERLWEQ